MKFFYLFFLYSCFSFSQNDVFAIARKGSVQEMIALEKDNPKSLNQIDTNGYSTLILATYYGNTVVANYLIKKCDNLNYNSKNGTALMAAVYKGDIAITQLLLNASADINVQDQNGQTALIMAINTKNIEIIKLLLKYQADQNIIDKNNKKAFDYALLSNNQQIIKLF